jgi:hypothetical protein
MDGRRRAARVAHSRPTAVVAVAGALVAVLAAWAGYYYGTHRDRGPACDAPVEITVAAAPEISPVLAQIAGRLTTAQRTEGGTCYLVQVFGQVPAQVAAALTGTSTQPAPDVWVPDSSYWLREVSAVNLDVPQQGQSIATSPTVLATPEPVARRLGWPDRPPGWDRVLAAGAPVPVGISDPGGGPVGLFGLIAARQAVQGPGRPDTALVAAFRALSKNVAPASENMLDTLARGSAGPDAVAAAPVSEQALTEYSRLRQPVRLVAIYPEPPAPGLDYPYVVLPGASDAARTAAQNFLGAVLTADPAEMASRGFRKPDGTAGQSFPTSGGLDARPVRPVELPPEQAVDGVLAQWAGVNRSGRVLTVIDISGSMNEPVPGTGKTRIELTRQTAQAGLGLFRPTTEFGLWVFSTNLDGPRDYRELMPLQTMFTGRTRAYQMIGQIQAKPNGGTGLYDTVLAGYQKMRAGWNPARINVLVVLTDGQNEDPAGISRQALLAKLHTLADPRRPLRIIFIGMGTGVNAAELSQIAGATGGRAYITPDPRRIGDIFLAALAFMTCTPPSCSR